MQRSGILNGLDRRGMRRLLGRASSSLGDARSPTLWSTVRAYLVATPYWLQDRVMEYVLCRGIIYNVAWEDPRIDGQASLPVLFPRRTACLTV